MQRGNASSGGAPDDGEKAVEIGPSRLPPTDELTDQDFEDFVERLLAASKFRFPPAVRVDAVERWGRPGDPQDGIDFLGDLSDGRKATWQCKHYKKFTAADAAKAVRDCTYLADVHHLMLSRLASTDVHAEMQGHAKWVLVDQRGLAQLLDELPPHKRRDVLDATWGATTRRRLMANPGEDAFLTLDSFIRDRLSPDTLLNDLGPMVARQDELSALHSALDRDGDPPQVVLVVGPGGRGKTRTLTEALRRAEERAPEVPILVLSPGRPPDPSALTELPRVPSVIVVDDAHRFAESIGAVLGYGRQVPGTQLIFATRPSGREALERECAQRLGPSDVRVVQLAELALRQARALVEGLAKGLELPYALTEHLASQATRGPHIAVIAINLIRRGELRKGLAVDEGLRRRVMERYYDVVAGDFEGLPAYASRRLLAVYAALGSVDADDSALEDAVATIVGVDRVAVLRLQAHLVDNGVLQVGDGRMRVVPDILGDDVLETEAAAGQRDTGFTSQLWSAFGATHGLSLLLNLAELDWRLRERGGPDVLGGLLDVLRDQLAVAPWAEIVAILRRTKQLAFTQPHRFIGILDELLASVEDRDDEVVGAEAASPGDLADESPASYSAAALRALAGLPPAQVEDVKAALAPLYGNCATAAPDLLEHVLDILWRLRRDDRRPPMQHPEHPERVVGDVLGDLSHLPDASFPERIVARIEAWLREPDEDAVATPLFALHSLVVKQGTSTSQTSKRSLSIGTWFASPARVRPLHDVIRALLLPVASGGDLRRAGAALDLLGDMLRQPHTTTSATVSDVQVIAWEDDDLATIAGLRHVAETTDSGVVRRIVRSKVSWSSARARSIPVRHAALELVTLLDERAEDDLAETLIGGLTISEPSRRNVPVPSVADLTAAEAADAARVEAAPPAERQQADNADLHRRVQERREAQDRLVVAVADALANRPRAEAVAMLDKCAREAAVLRPRRPLGLPPLMHQVAQRHPEVMRDLVTAVAALDAGPLDESLYVLLAAWARADPDGVVGWLGDLEEHRAAVRIAVAEDFARYDWGSKGPPFERLFERGCGDHDDATRTAFLAASHFVLAADAARGASLLLASNAPALACVRALEQACGYEGAPWGEQLTAMEAAAVLDLVDRAGWHEYTLQQIVSGIARSHPRLVLDHLASAGEQVALGHADFIDGLSEALGAHGDVVAAWLLDTSNEPADIDRAAVVGFAFADLSASVASALENRVAVATPTALVALCDRLRDLRTWPQRHPALARAALARARELGGNDIVREVTATIQDGTQLRVIGYMNGVSSELNAALVLTDSRRGKEPDEGLRAVFDQASARMRSLAASLREDDDEDD